MKRLIAALACAMVLFAAGEDIGALQKACDDGNAISCGSLGFLYGNGQGVRQDYKKASELYSKACDMGYADACFNLGVVYYDGKGVRQDKGAVKEYFGKACDLGNQGGCNNYKILNEQGL